MNKLNRYIVRAIIFLFLPFCTSAQQILFKNYSVADGLPSATVRAIAQDAQGYMWFGTKNGLSRFDGYQFKNFQYSKNTPNAIGHNFIYCITTVDSTHLWIGTENGIYILNLETARFTPFEPVREKRIGDILKDKDGIIWITTRLHGLYRYDPAKNATINYKSGNSDLSSNELTKLAQDDDGNIWIGTLGAGINLYNPLSKTFSTLPLNNRIINTIYKGKDGTMWIGTMNGGLYKYQHRTFRTYTHTDSPSSIKDNIVRAICQIGPDKLYVGTEKGLNVLDLATDRFTAYTNSSNDPFSIGDNSVYTIYPDKAGMLWVGTFFGGVSYFNEKGSDFELYYPTGEPGALSGRAVSCFLEEAPGKLLVGTEDGGLQYFNATTKTFSRFPYPLSYHNIHTLLKDKNGHIWIGIFAGGINIYDPYTGKIQHLLGNENVFCIYQDKDDQIWVGTDRGLSQYNNGQFTSILQEGMTNTIIYDIYEDDNKTLWFATYYNGLHAYNKKTRQWKNIHEEDKNKLTCLYDDHKGNLWIGTDGMGLHKYTPATNTLTVSSIHANVIYGIQPDDRGQLWVTTNNGIYAVDLKSEKAKHYLQNQQFNYKALYKAADGKLYAGGIKGFNAFYPEQLTTTPEDIKVSFTNFQLFNKNVSVSDKQINYIRRLVLDHNQSVLSFEFAALDFSAPEKMSYAYKMQGFDHDWNYVGDQRKATYTNLAPGTYTFKVKATRDESNWNVPESTIRLVIKPPFYRTTVAYLIYLLIMLAIIYVIHKYIRKQHQVKLERLKNKEEQAFYAQKIEFFTVMAHEIRTPLSLIIAPLEKLLAMSKWEKEEKEQLTIMDENAERLMDLVNQLLDFRRIESDAYKVEKENIEVISFVQAIYSRFSSLPYQKNIDFTLSTKVSSLLLHADPEVLNKILSNLLINAFKFARKQVHLIVYLEGPNVCISIEDDGMGIPAADIKNIFKKFFTVSQENQSSGIGLALASALAEKHGGRLLVESREKTIFTLELPVTTNITQKTEEREVVNNDRPLILIVEDDASIQSFLATSLREIGYNTINANNGTTALQLIEDKDIDLVISDVMMPEMDGLELCRQVKNNIHHSHIPIILLTAKGSHETELEGLEAGADAYIMKPFRWKHIAAKVRNLIESRETLRLKYAASPNSDISVLATNSTDKQFMEKVVSIIESRITDSQLSVEELSRDMAMSRSNLHKKLKSLSGYVPNELIKLVRLKHAARLLLTTDHPISEIAYMTGFSSPSYFSKCFLQQFKMTPKEYCRAGATGQ